ncbi:MAG: EAL domain-containing protein [Candidatus Thiodiazotropha sp. (ex Dulcina madagascariensis)]|nr:EAL domain-containing protein [Candidatus Thiodiazotropha sp. (ex Dulcina madagascariensis)]MCU7926893.1 EAL domain-containing protein [Candidatus Thiodiazotropha sp. (ex Dulcina madagascariensis)]
MTTHNIIREFLKLAISWVSVLLLIVFLIYLWRVETSFEQLRIRESLLVELSAETLSRLFAEPLTNTLLLSNNVAFENWNREAGSRLRRRLENSLFHFMEYKQLYDQLRFIDIHGMERVRIDTHTGEPRTIPLNALQNKSERYYFIETQKLKRNEVYLSPLDLNIEHGEIEKPHKPTIRLATPVFNHRNERIGVLVINYLAETMLQRFASTAGNSIGEIMLLNNEGYWLYHPNDAMRWGFMLESGLSLPHALPEEWRHILRQAEKQWETANGLFTIQHTTPFDEAHTDAQSEDSVRIVHSGGYPWVVVSRVNAEALLGVKRRIAKNLALTTGPATLLLLISLYFIARHNIHRARQQALIADSESRKRSILDSVADGIMTVSANGLIVEANPAAEGIFDLSEKRLLTSRITDLLTSDAARAQLRKLLQFPLRSSASEGISRQFETLGVRGDGSPFPLEMTLSPLHLGGQSLNTVLLRDVCEKRVTERELMLAGEVFETATEGILVTDSNVIIQRVNPAFCRLTGYRPEELIGNQPSLLRSHETDNSAYRQMWRKINDTGRWEGEIRNRMKNGEVRTCYLSIFAIKDDSGTVVNYGSLSRDITEEKETEERIRRHAYYDGLTGLPNRTLFLERLQQALNHSDRYNECFGLFFIDLDRFKSVNDTLGHEAGDRLLQSVGERIGDIIRETDTLARLAGDEFSLLLHNIDRNDDLVKLAQKIVTVLGEPFDIQGKSVHIGASIGICIYPVDGKDASTLLRYADLAMYQAKHSGKNTYRFFSDELSTTIKRHTQLETDLRHAINEEQFELHYQPFVDYQLCTVVGAEALLRWNHPTQGWLSPAEFIPLAEETGLIRPLSEWVIRNAATQLSTWRNPPLVPLTLSVNLSAYRNHHAVDKGFVEDVLRETGAPPDRLTFEITESLIMENTAESLAWLTFMKALGIRMAINDFGTGHSSLSYLKQFPVDILKIDRSFIADMALSQEGKAMVMTIIAIAKNLNLQVIAEGVENQRQLDMLQGKQDYCTVIQGFLFAPAMPADEFASFVMNFDASRYSTTAS